MPQHPLEPIQKIFFDCDGTLSLIEGINVIAEFNGVGKEVSDITLKCMSETGMLPEAYRQRLHLVKPQLQQIQDLGGLYIQHVAPGAKELIECFNYLKKDIYIISAGIKAAITLFAKYLEIPEAHILAVDVFFDENDQYKAFDEQCYMVYPDGKSRQIKAVNQMNPGLSALIGDGVSDLEAKPVVNRFIGYGGFSIKQRVRDEADFYLASKHFMPLLSLCLTQEEHQQIRNFKEAYYHESLYQQELGEILIKEF
ncbi:phosphoserine phosphatase [Legionella birminghamensis]|uniref:phosphoserine phosphatase n=2 Tax=Legionella birminghamensis TaxID=28083 RepID=A0A378I6P7_9GAMM|nr:HAD-IB family phosphatase [Legionella birminghamensis]KTC71514.1 phosphoserine phosphatase [Legionella birminghamensis]STX30878.1 phosphoserine phosphatase [Legionella birminghamensis]